MGVYTMRPFQTDFVNEVSFLLGQALTLEQAQAEVQNCLETNFNIESVWETECALYDFKKSYKSWLAYHIEQES
jgi:hypothetical protein